VEGKRCATSAGNERENLVKAYSDTRELSEKICETLESEDCLVQAMPEANPTKWHLAHTSWSFETFVLRTAFQNYQTVRPSYSFLFNSYYNAVGKMHARPKHGLISRPRLRETKLYRRRVDEAMDSLFQNAPLTAKFGKVIELGSNHEQQHQELMVTDIKNVFLANPLRLVFRNGVAPSSWQFTGLRLARNADTNKTLAT
jgi:DinB superfamily